MSRDDPPNILRRALVRNRWRLVAGSLLVGLHQGSEALVPIVIGVIVDQAVSTGSSGRLVTWMAALAGLFVLLTAAYRTGARQLMRAVADEAHRLRLEIAVKVLDPRAEARTGDVLSISATDTDHTSYLLDYIPRIVGALTAATVSAVGLCLISVRLGLVVLIGTPLVVLALRRAAKRRDVADRSAAGIELRSRHHGGEGVEDMVPRLLDHRHLGGPVARPRAAVEAEPVDVDLRTGGEIIDHAREHPLGGLAAADRRLAGRYAAWWT